MRWENYSKAGRYHLRHSSHGLTLATGQQMFAKHEKYHGDIIGVPRNMAEEPETRMLFFQIFFFAFA